MVKPRRKKVHAGKLDEFYPKVRTCRVPARRGGQGAKRLVKDGAAVSVRHAQMVPAIAMTRCGDAAAKLGRDLVHLAERPVTASGVEFED